MHSLEEIAGWSLEEIRREILKLLPKDHRLIFGPGTDEDTLSVHIETPEGKLLWRREGFEERTLLLDAFGWLWTQKRPAPGLGTPWAQKRFPKLQHVPFKTSGIPDPADVDPEEVLAVYGYGRKKAT
jgi:hypothetical protein